MIKRPLSSRLFGSNLFGSAEYYLGMPSGMVRYACVLLFALAFLNARHYTPAQIEADNKYQERWYGAHFFPDLYTVQDQVFEKSFTGPYIKKYLGVLLIEPDHRCKRWPNPHPTNPAECNRPAAGGAATDAEPAHGRHDFSRNP